MADEVDVENALVSLIVAALSKWNVRGVRRWRTL
jgi:hypothetical protein